MTFIQLIQFCINYKTQQKWTSISVEEHVSGGKKHNAINCVSSGLERWGGEQFLMSTSVKQ